MNTTRAASTSLSTPTKIFFKSGREKGFFIAMIIFVAATIIFAGLYGASSSKTECATDASNCDCPPDCSDCSANYWTINDDGSTASYCPPVCSSGLPCCSGDFTSESSDCFVCDSSCCVDASYVCTIDQCTAYCMNNFGETGVIQTTSEKGIFVEQCACENSAIDTYCPEDTSQCKYTQNTGKYVSLIEDLFHFISAKSKLNVCLVQ